MDEFSLNEYFEHFENLLSKDAWTRLLALKAIRKMDKKLDHFELFELFELALKQGSPKTRRGAIFALGTLKGNEEDRENKMFIFKQALEDSDDEVRCFAVMGLGKMGKNLLGVESFLLSNLKDSCKRVRYYTLKALEKVGFSSEFSLSKVLEMLQDPDEWVKVAALQCLERFFEQAGSYTLDFSALISLTENSDFWVRGQAIQTLGTIRERECLPLSILKTALGDEYSLVRKSAVVALGRMGPDAKSEISILKELLKDPQCYFSAKWALEQILLGQISQNDQNFIDVKTRGFHPIPLKITSLQKVSNTISNWNPSHLISIFDYGSENDVEIDPSILYHKQYFDDLETDLDNPSTSQIKELLQFSANLKESDRLLIHCNLGVSRSTAVALGVLLQKGYREIEALESLLDLRPLASPNLAVLGKIDALLGTQAKNLVSIWKRQSQERNAWGWEALEQEEDPLSFQRFLKKQKEEFQKFKKIQSR